MLNLVNNLVAIIKESCASTNILLIVQEFYIKYYVMAFQRASISSNKVLVSLASSKISYIYTLHWPVVLV